ncbi:polysaccharide deacetylase family protein [Streptomyces sp. NPDC020096]
MRQGRVPTALALVVLCVAVMVTAVAMHGRGRTEPAVGHAPPRAITLTRHLGPSGSPPLSTRRTPAVDCRKTKCVALTFDDGPSRYTASLLNILDARHAKATFFQIGPHALAFPQVARRAYREGFAIGDHTVTHPHLTRISTARIRYEVRTAARQIARVTGHAPTIMRPPFGAQDARVRAAVGMPLIMWDVGPRDWKIRKTPSVERGVLTKVHPGAIVLLHDTYPTTIAAVPHIVDVLHARGYTLVTVPQLLAHPGMSPGVAYSHGP